MPSDSADESDLAFVQRLMAEEGLFCWFEHEAAEGDALGLHTLVIADHNGSFKPNAQASIAFSQAARAVALLNGRDHVIPEDVKTLAHRVLRHRLILNFVGGAGFVGIAVALEAV